MRSAFIASIAALGVGAIAIVLAVVAIAESGGSSNTDTLEASIEDLDSSLFDLQTGVTTAQLVAALDALDGAGIHEFDEQTTQAASRDDVPTGYSAAVDKLHAVVSNVQWPADVQDSAQELTDLAPQLMAALGGDDLAAIKELSPQFHAAWHGLREVGYAALGGEQPAHGEMNDHME